MMTLGSSLVGPAAAYRSELERRTPLPIGGNHMENPSLSVRLFGTEEPVTPPQILRAGPLSAELEAGNLRYIRFDGRELIRAVSFIVRNKNWGTYNPEISNLDISASEDEFRVTYDAVTRDAEQEFRYSAEIVGKAEGRLVFRAKGRAVTDFVTNRTGFVVLHPLEGVAGRPARVEQVDGRTVDATFPELIDPVQPMMDLRAITHHAGPGLVVTCRMEGDTFEMEDQRNWTDASYKTYVRPLALPWPYTLPAGTELEQAVTLTVHLMGARTGGAEAGGETPIVTFGEPAGSIPPLGFGLDPDHAEAALERADLLRAAGPDHVICHFDARRGHGREHLARMLEVAKAIGAAAWLELVVTRVEGFEDEVAEAGRIAAELGSPFAVVLVSPASDLKSTLPGSEWPPAPPLEQLYRATRQAFPNARIGGGMFSYFTELNRKRPPLDDLDLVTFTTSGLIHAGDDRTAMETLEALPYIAKSVAAIAGGRPWNAGPSALGMRSNPYGAAPAENPQNIRQAMNRMDPRQRGLLGAAWYLGYFAHMARGGAASVTLGGGVGEFGIVHARMPYAQPHFDEAKGVYPAFHVFKGLARLKGGPMLAAEAKPARSIQAVAAETSEGREIWLANLTGEPIAVSLQAPIGQSQIFVLDAENFGQASVDADAAEHLSRPFEGGAVELGPYAVASICGR
jgi:hypothetical protein